MAYGHCVFLCLRSFEAFQELYLFYSQLNYHSLWTFRIIYSRKEGNCILKGQLPQCHAVCNIKWLRWVINNWMLGFVLKLNWINLHINIQRDIWAYFSVSFMPYRYFRSILYYEKFHSYYLLLNILVNDSIMIDNHFLWIAMVDSLNYWRFC